MERKVRLARYFLPRSGSIPAEFCYTIRVVGRGVFDLGAAVFGSDEVKLQAAINSELTEINIHLHRQLLKRAEGLEWNVVLRNDFTSRPEMEMVEIEISEELADQIVNNCPPHRLAPYSLRFF